MAYLGIDIGGSKTLVAIFSTDGVIEEEAKFATPQAYSDFIKTLKTTLEKLDRKNFTAVGVAVPGVIDRYSGVGIALGNLPWKNIPIRAELERLTKAPVAVENDANLAGLSEAKLLKGKYHKVLYLTISTGIGGGVIVDGAIDPSLVNSEPGHMILEHNGVMQKWEEFASGKAIVKEYGKKAEEITDPNIWRKIAANLTQGLLDLLAILQPEVIIIGGSVGSHFDKFGGILEEQLNQYHNPIVPIPKIIQAVRPESAVVYGCFEFAKASYGIVR